MKESANAVRAWADYLAMGPERSLEALVRRYRTAIENPPTRRLMTLADWSRTFGWQARLKEIADRQAREAEAQEAEYRQSILEEGFGLKHERVKALKAVAQRLYKTASQLDPLDDSISAIRLETILSNFRGTLDDIAKEKSERKEVKEVTGKDGSPLIPATEKKVLDADDLARLAAEVFSLGRVDSGDASTDGGGELVDTPQPDT